MDVGMNNSWFYIDNYDTSQRRLHGLLLRWLLLGGRAAAIRCAAATALARFLCRSSCAFVGRSSAVGLELRKPKQPEQLAGGAVA